MNKALLGMLIGGFLGIFDGLSALVSAPETRTMIASIVIGSTVKGIIAGLLIGWFARKVDSLAAGIVFGLSVGLFLAWLVALMPSGTGEHYYWEIMIPGAIVGMIVGYATQRYGRRADTAAVKG
jgi:hypothetical protein